LGDFFTLHFYQQIRTCHQKSARTSKQLFTGDGRIRKQKNASLALKTEYEKNYFQIDFIETKMYMVT